MKSIRGQSTVEFAVAVSSLALLAFAMLAVGAWQEAQRRVLVAARQATFESLWGEAAVAGDRADRLHRRHFADAGMQMPVTGGAIAAPGDLSVSGFSEPLQGATGAAETGLIRLLDAGPLPADQFDPGGRGWMGARVALLTRPMAFLPAPLESLQLRLEGRMALLNDGWSAASSAHVAQRAGAMVPGRALAPLRQVLQPLLVPLSLFEPSVAQFCPGLIDAEGIPEDRLSAATRPAPTWNSCR